MGMHSKRTFANSWKVLHQRSGEQGDENGNAKVQGNMGKFYQTNLNNRQPLDIRLSWLNSMSDIVYNIITYDHIYHMSLNNDRNQRTDTWKEQSLITANR